jgi:hypothetical protein
MTDITLTVAELRSWCAKTLDVLEADEHTRIVVPKGLYYIAEPARIWELPPAPPTVGDSDDDVVTLRDEAAQAPEDLVAPHSLGHLIGILTVVASQIGNGDSRTRGTMVSAKGMR